MRGLEVEALDDVGHAANELKRRALGNETVEYTAASRLDLDDELGAAMEVVPDGTGCQRSVRLWRTRRDQGGTAGRRDADRRGRR